MHLGQSLFSLNNLQSPLSEQICLLASEWIAILMSIPFLIFACLAQDQNPVHDFDANIFSSANLTLPSHILDDTCRFISASKNAPLGRCEKLGGLRNLSFRFLVIYLGSQIKEIGQATNDESNQPNSAHAILNRTSQPEARLLNKHPKKRESCTINLRLPCPKQACSTFLLADIRGVFLLLKKSKVRYLRHSSTYQKSNIVWQTFEI